MTKDNLLRMLVCGFALAVVPLVGVRAGAQGPPGTGMANDCATGQDGGGSTATGTVTYPAGFCDPEILGPEEIADTASNRYSLHSCDGPCAAGFTWSITALDHPQGAAAIAGDGTVTVDPTLCESYGRYLVTYSDNCGLELSRTIRFVGEDVWMVAPGAQGVGAFYGCSLWIGMMDRVRGVYPTYCMATAACKAARGSDCGGFNNSLGWAYDWWGVRRYDTHRLSDCLPDSTPLPLESIQFRFPTDHNPSHPAVVRRNPAP